MWPPCAVIRKHKPPEVKRRYQRNFKKKKKKKKRTYWVIFRKIRPIAIGEVYRRLVAKVALKLTLQKAVNILAPLQQCVGVKGAAENIVRFVRLLMQKQRIDDVCLQVDLSNAFNSLDRHHMLGEISKSFQSCINGHFFFVMANHLTYFVGIFQSSLPEGYSKATLSAPCFLRSPFPPSSRRQNRRFLLANKAGMPIMVQLWP